MIVALLAFLGGALTIISPCTLPVLPFVFARTDRPFVRSTLPLLIGMTLTFAAVATLAAVGGSWAVHVNSVGRIAALALLGLFGLALVSRHLAEWLARPAVALGNRLMQSGSGTGGGTAADAGAGAAARGGATQSFVLGVATGLLWAPCAGPILGLILTGAAISGPNARTTLLLLCYAAGAAVSLAVATLAGRGVFRALRRSFAVSDAVRRGLGVLILAAVAVIALGWDTGILTQLSIGGTNRIEQSLVTALRPAPAPSASERNSMAMAMAVAGAMTAQGTAGGAAGGTGAAGALPIEGVLPPLTGAVAWINSPALTPQDLRGKVVLVDFWTYSCINCLRTLPYLKAWYQRYKDHGLIILGVHSPEFAFEKEVSNVQRAVHTLGIEYPVAVDSNLSIWQAFNNEYWPADYFVDAMGRIRGHQFGEGGYDDTEQTLRELLTQAGYTNLQPAGGGLQGQGAEAAPDLGDIQSPETYIGYERAANFASPGSVAPQEPKTYVVPVSLQLNQWALGGNWIVDGQYASLQQAPGSIVFHFHARDLHLVLGPAGDGRPIHFRVTLDGHEPGDEHGADTDAHGNGVVSEQRLYQLIRQSGAVTDHTFAIEFLDAGVQAYSFTFG